MSIVSFSLYWHGLFLTPFDSILVLASEDISDANETDDTQDNNNMSSSTAATKKKKKSSSSSDKKKTGAADGLLKSPPVPVSFNLFACDAFQKTRYVFDDKDIIELEIFVNGCIPNHAYKAELSPDKTTFFWKRGTPRSVFNPARLEQSMPAGTYNPNHTRVAAHSETHQKVLASEPDSNRGWYFCGSPVSIDLGAQVVGDPTVYFSKYKVCEFDGHAQYNTIYSFIMEVASQRIQAKKKATQTQVLTLDFDDDDDDEDDVGRRPSCAAARRGESVQQLPFMQPRDGGAKGKGKGGGSRRTITAAGSITTTKAALPSQTMTTNSMAKRPVSFSNSDGSGSSSSGDSSGSEDDDDSDLDVKPPAKSVKREVKSEVKSKAAACIELDSDDE